MKKILACITLLFIVSCGKQTAPALELQDTDAVQVSSEVDRVELPNPQKATFAAETEVIEETNPTETPEHGPAPDVDKDKKIVTEKPKKEIKVEPEVLFPDFAWEKYMVEPGDFLIKIAKREYGDFRLWRQIYAWNKDEIGENPNIIYPQVMTMWFNPVTISGISPGINMVMQNHGLFFFGIMKILSRQMPVYLIPG